MPVLLQHRLQFARHTVQLLSEGREREREREKKTEIFHH
jgi:hypothetical protein